MCKGSVVLRNVQTNETRTTTEYQLIDAIQRGAVNRVESSGGGGLSATLMARVEARQESETAVSLMLDKRAWIEGLRARGIDRISDEVWVRAAIQQLAASDLKGTRKFATSTLAETARELVKVQGDWSQLVPKYSQRGGAGKSRLDPRVEQVIDSVLADVKQGSGKVVKTEICDSVRDSINTLNLAAGDHPILVPGSTTISRRIDSHFTARERCERNRGSTLANKNFRDNSFPRDVAEFPLLISEYDDIDSGLFLIDEANGLPFGRAHITHGVCQNSGVPLGFDLSHKPRSYESAMGAIADSWLPKDTSLPAFEGCLHPWVGYGMQGTILMDNATYNFSRSMRYRSDELILMLAGTKPYGPTEKCAIEHFNDIVKNYLCSTLPGWRGDKSDPDSVKNGMKSAVFTVQAFRRAYVQWVTGVYLNKAGVDGWTPRQRWDRHFDGHGPAIRWSREQIALLRLRPTYLRFRDSGGVKPLGLTYNSDELIKLRDQVGANARVIAFRDSKDLTYLMVKNPLSRELLRVPCTTDFRYTNGLTEHQQRLILKAARDRGVKNPKLADMVAAREALRVLVTQEANSTKLTKRRWAQRVGQIPETVDAADQVGDEQPKAMATHETVERVMTKLEWSMVQLEQVEIDIEDEEWASA